MQGSNIQRVNNNSNENLLLQRIIKGLVLTLSVLSVFGIVFWIASRKSSLNAGDAKQDEVTLANNVEHSSNTYSNSLSLINQATIFESFELTPPQPIQESFSASELTESVTYNLKTKRDDIASDKLYPLAITRQLNKIDIYDQTKPVIVATENNGAASYWLSVGQGVAGNVFDSRMQASNSIEHVANTIKVGTFSSLSVLRTPNVTFLLWGNRDGLVSYPYITAIDDAGNIIQGGGDLRVGTDLSYSDLIQPTMAKIVDSSNKTRIFINWFNVFTQGSYGKIYTYDNSSFNSVTSSYPTFNFASTHSITGDNVNKQFITGTSYNSGGGDPTTFSAYSQRYNSAGNAVGSTFRINKYTAGNQVLPYLVELKSGYQAVWYDEQQDSSKPSFFINQFGSTDVSLNNVDTQVNQPGTSIIINTEPGSNIAAAGPSDSVVTTYASLNQNTNDGISDIHSAWFNRTQLIGRRFRLTSQGDYSMPSVAVSKDGKTAFYVWQKFKPTTILQNYPAGYDIHGVALQLRLDPYVYNTDVALDCSQNLLCPITTLVVNPMVDADSVNVTLKIPPTVGYLNTPSSATYSYGNATATYNITSGSFFVSGHVVPVNNLLSQLMFMPADYYTGEFKVQISALDSVHSNFNDSLSINVLPVNYPPILQLQTLVVDQGQSVALTPDIMSAINPDPNVNRPFTYDIDRMLQANIINTDTNQNIFNFTGAQLNSNKIVLNADDTGFPISFQVTASDGILSSEAEQMPIFFNKRPVITNNQFPIISNVNLTLTSQHLNGSDESTPWDLLQWKLYDVKQASFFNSSTGLLLPIIDNAISFTNSDIHKQYIVVAPSQTTTSPAWNMNIFDGRIYSDRTPVQANINFQYVLPPETTSSSNTSTDPLPIGLSIAAAATVLLGAGFTTFFCVRRAKDKQKAADWRATREASGYELHNTIREKLGLKNILNFSEGEGLEFVNAIDEICRTIDSGSKAQISLSDPNTKSEYHAPLIANAIRLTNIIQNNKLDPVKLRESTNLIAEKTLTALNDRAHNDGANDYLVEMSSFTNSNLVSKR